MHSYLRAVGLSEYKDKRELEGFLRDIIKEPGRKISTVEEDDKTFIMIEKCFGEDFGICICGEYDDNNIFYMDYYFPVFYGYGITTHEKPGIERHAAHEEYSGLCDDFRVGISIIFYVNNVIDYKKSMQNITSPGQTEGVTLSALSTKGKILLPINKTEQQKRAEKDAVKERNQLLTAARQGDERAIESLTLEDIDTFSRIGQRVGKEDILSIVETYFMPRGIECDQYTILGEILECRKDTNTFTGEQIYVMTVTCNELVFDLCINEKDLLGVPETGRRIKADIWLQGTVHFAE